MISPMRRYKVSTQPALCVCAEGSSRHFLHRRRSGRRDCRHFLFSDWETRITHEILANRKVSVPFVGTCRVHNAGPSIHILHYNSRGSARVALWAPLSVISLYRTQILNRLVLKYFFYCWLFIRAGVISPFGRRGYRVLELFTISCLRKHRALSRARKKSSRPPAEQVKQSFSF